MLALQVRAKKLKSATKLKLENSNPFIEAARCDWPTESNESEIISLDNCMDESSKSVAFNSRNSFSRQLSYQEGLQPGSSKMASGMNQQLENILETSPYATFASKIREG